MYKRQAYDCLESGEPFRIEPPDARAALALALAVGRSVASGQPEQVDA